MARPSTITDEQILDAAREIFFRDGTSATTADIARHAGVSEGTIFRRFPTKVELFKAAMGFEGGPQWIETVEQLVVSDEPGDIRENLTQIAAELLDFFAVLIPKMNMVLSSGASSKPSMLFDSNELPPPIMGVKALMKYFMAAQAAGQIDANDPEILARIFLASFHHYAFWEYCGLNSFLPMPRPTYIRHIVESLLRSAAFSSSNE